MEKVIDEERELFEARVEELTCSGFKAAQIVRTLQASRERVLDAMESIATRRREAVASKVEELRSADLAAADAMLRVCWVEMQQARQAAAAVARKDEDGRPLPMNRAEAEVTARMQSTAVRWARLWATMREFRANLTGTVLKADRGGITIPSEVLKDKELTIALRDLPKEDVAAVTEIFRRRVKA